MQIRKIKNIYLKKNTIEWIFVLILFLFSFINSATLLLFMGMLLLYFLQKEIGALKIINLLTLRTIINPGIAVSIDRYQLIKLAIIFICSFFILLSYNKIPKFKKKKYNILIFAILTFGICSILSSWFNSTLPVIAIFKVVSYVIPFISILIGVSITKDEIDWLSWLETIFKYTALFSIPLIFLPVGYFVNGFGFQGITNQPNMFGILMFFYLAILYTKLQQYKKIEFKDYITIFLIFYLIILSKSRTALISAVLLSIVFYFFLNIGLKRKVITAFIVTSTIFIITIFAYDELLIPLLEFIEEFMYKGQGTILFSRSSQIDSVMQNFYRNPIFGSGFAVPVTQYRSLSFSANVNVEPGNLLMSVLSYSGIYGFILFIVYLLLLLFLNIKYLKTTFFLFFAPLLISMGEMIFFSTNSIGIWCYFLLGIYFGYEEK